MQMTSTDKLRKMKAVNAQKEQDDNAEESQKTMRDSDLTEEQKQIKDEVISEMKKFQDVMTDDFPIDGLHFSLRSLSLENFKSVSQQDINFKPLSVVVGANSLGRARYFNQFFY